MKRDKSSFVAKMGLFLLALLLAGAVGGIGYSLGRRGRTTAEQASSDKPVKLETAVPDRKGSRPVRASGETVSKDGADDCDVAATPGKGGLMTVDDPTAAQNFKVREDIRQFVLQEFESGSADKPTGKAANLFRQIREYGDGQALAALGEMIRNGSPAEKKAALFAVGAAYGRSNEAPDPIDEGGGVAADSSAQASTESEAALTHDIVQTVQTGLEDGSPDIRLAAYESAMMLKEEEMGILTMQMLSSDADPALSRALVADTSGSKDESSLKISMTALDSGDAETRAAAAENLQGMLGQSFKSSEEAFSWWEENRLNVLDGVVQHEPGELVTVANAGDDAGSGARADEDMADTDDFGPNTKQEKENK